MKTPQQVLILKAPSLTAEMNLRSTTEADTGEQGYQNGHQQMAIPVGLKTTALFVTIQEA